jgi:surfactin synthase thioesterase subunit
LLDYRLVGIDDDFFSVGGTPETCGRMFEACGALVNEPVGLDDISGTLSVRNLASVLVARLEARASGVARTGLRPFAVAEPQDCLQDRLADLCERLLGQPKIGVDDELLSLGGTRESTERIFTAVEELYGERLTSDDLPTGRITVRQICDALVARIRPTRVMQIQAGAPHVPPLVFCHGDIGGGGRYVRDLARVLGPDQSVFVLSPHGMHGDDVPASIEAIAADHIAALQPLLTDGPVYLGGYCISAIVAYEMARQLTARDCPVVRSLLIDPLFVSAPRGLAWLPPPRLSAQARQLPSVRVPWLVALYRFIVSQYRYGPYSGPVDVFWGNDDRPALDGPHVRAMVKALAPSVEFHMCPGTHHSILGRQIDVTATVVRECLQARPRRAS